MKRWPALLTIAVLSFVALTAPARADSFGNSVSWTVPTGGGGNNTTTPAPNQIGGILWRPNPVFTFVIEGFSNIVDFFGSRGNSSADSYWWDFGDGHGGSSLNMTHAYNVNGLWQTFTVTFRHCNLLYCSSDSQRVTVYSWPGILVIAAAAASGLFMLALVHNLGTVQRNERRIWSKVTTARVQMQVPKMVRHPVRTVKRARVQIQTPKVVKHPVRTMKTSVRRRSRIMRRKIVVRK